jgi:hypothetical protein
MQAAEPIVAAEAAVYDTRAAVNELHLTPTANSVGSVTHQEMAALYDDKFAKRGFPGRRTYERIRNSAPKGVCSLCKHQVATTLDHFLPKSHHPGLSVHTRNLIPACRDCNTNKLAHVASAANEQLLHPYYDDVSGVRWLACRLVRGQPLTVGFEVDASNVSVGIAERLRTHMAVLSLPATYRPQALDALGDVKQRLVDTGTLGGPEAVRSYLVEELSSREARDLNSWSSALFRALVASQWFIEGGYVDIAT